MVLTRMKNAEIRDRVSTICLGFPEATVERSGAHATFRVRGKVFAYFLDDHHGDGIVSVCFKTRLDTGKVDWKEVTQLAGSYRNVAPKRLAAALAK
jgi:hypothetical protein